MSAQSFQLLLFISSKAASTLQSLFSFLQPNCSRGFSIKPKPGFEAVQSCAASLHSPILQAQSGFKVSFSNAIKLEKVNLSHMLEWDFSLFKASVPEVLSLLPAIDTVLANATTNR